MKRKRLIIVTLTIVMLVIGLLLHSKWHAIFTSKQMKDLRQLEASLNLPKPKYRYEEDLGLNKDSKGALHYDRHIALSYEDSSVLSQMRAALLHSSWQEQASGSVGEDHSFSFKKGSGSAMQCVSGYTRPKDSDGITLYISLEAAGEYSCNPAPGV